MDISGGHQLDVVHNIFKTRLDPSGRPIHSEKQSLYSSQLCVCVRDSGIVGSSDSV
jgi:predicted small secreted protein